MSKQECSGCNELDIDDGLQHRGYVVRRNVGIKFLLTISVIVFESEKKDRCQRAIIYS